MQTTQRGTIREADGFTFVEIITALVLLAIFSSMAVPAMGGYVDKVRTRGALDQLVGDVGYARILAIQQGRRTRVTVSSGATYSVDTISNGGAWGSLRSVNLDLDYQGVAFTTPITLEFSSRGLLTNQATDGYIKIMKNEAKDSIFVSPAGRIYRGCTGLGCSPS